MSATTSTECHVQKELPRLEAMISPMTITESLFQNDMAGDGLHSTE